MKARSPVAIQPSTRRQRRAREPASTRMPTTRGPCCAGMGRRLSPLKPARGESPTARGISSTLRRCGIKRAGFVFQLLHQAHNAHRFFDQRDFPYQMTGHPHLQVALGVHHVDFGPGNAAEPPLVMFDADNGRIERERPGPELVERRRNVRRVHYSIYKSSSLQMATTSAPLGRTMARGVSSSRGAH